MTDSELSEHLISLYSQYVEWLRSSKDISYGELRPGVYGGAIAPTFSGFMKWLQLVPPS